MKITPDEFMDLVEAISAEGDRRERVARSEEAEKWKNASARLQDAAEKQGRDEGHEAGRREGLAFGRDQAFDEILEIIKKASPFDLPLLAGLRDKIESARHPF